MGMAAIRTKWVVNNGCIFVCMVCVKLLMNEAVDLMDCPWCVPVEWRTAQEAHMGRRPHQEADPSVPGSPTAGRGRGGGLGLGGGEWRKSGKYFE